ncbi:MAG: class I SAM-dependent methyltransferase [Spirochaetales bacterium]|nr:class I SAM-dependent methyltransferase [Spirochaetales bacterium]
MPSMYEIYKEHAAAYDELVNAEDYAGNLRAFLQRATDWHGTIVCEAGIGTGRVTRMYIDSVQRVYGFDRETHMLDACSINLADYSSRLELAVGNNTEFPGIPEKADIFIEGWSFLHTMADNEDHCRSVFAKMYREISLNLKKNAIMILIESLGTNVQAAAPPTPAAEKFYALLELEYGFSRHILNTDYRFPSCNEAARIMGFFFGNRMAELVSIQGKSVVPEFTGVWKKQLN